MRSPFPGMDPFLEAPDVYPDFHHELASQIRRAIVPRLRPPYVARVYHREVTDLIGPGEVRILYPDVAVTRRRRGPSPAMSPQGAGASVAQLTPSVEVALPLPSKVPQFRVEVQVARSRELVAAIEIVSPANKRPGSPDAEAYRRKREEYLASDVHFLELDFVRAYERWSPPDAPMSTYRVLLSRSTRRDRASIWAVRLSDPLPVVPVPLRAPDSDVPIDLQAIVTAAYECAEYAGDLDYGATPPPPPLSLADSRWMRSLLRRFGRP